MTATEKTITIPLVLWRAICAIALLATSGVAFWCWNVSEQLHEHGEQLIRIEAHLGITASVADDRGNE